jgi:uncharacterized membrane protein YfhO
VEVDGQRRNVQHVDGVLIGVLVPPGEHEVRWAYETPGLTTGIAVSAAGVGAAACWLGLVLVRRRRLTEHENEAEPDNGDAEAP